MNVRQRPSFVPKDQKYALHTRSFLGRRIWPKEQFRLGLRILSLLATSACASAPPPELRPLVSEGKSSSFLANKNHRAGNSFLLSGYCSEIKDEKQFKICEAILRGRSFDPKALSICGPLKGSESKDVNGCLKSIADVFYSEASLALCGRMENSKHKRKCLSATANRRLGNSQVNHCASLKDANKIIRCLGRTTNYVFDPDVLQRVVLKSLHGSPPPDLGPPPTQLMLRKWWQLSPGERHSALRDEARYKAKQQESISQLFETIRNNVAEAFPQLQVERSKYNFLFNFAGGANGQMQLLYCSDKEYLLLFGAPISVDAYSGRYRVLHIYDWVLSGKVSVFHEGDFVSHDTYPGQETFLARDNTKTYATEPMTYLLEYGRGGATATGLEFGVRAPARALTRDFRNQRKQIQACGRLAAKEEIEIIARKIRKRRKDRQRKQSIQRDIRRALRN